MPKQSPYYLKRPKPAVAPYVFADKRSNPDNEFHLDLRTLTSFEMIHATEKGAEYAVKYVTGYGEPGKPGHVPPVNLPPIDGEPVFVSQGTCNILAAIEMAQVQPAADRYTFEELCCMCAVPQIQGQVMEAYYAIQPRAEADDSPLGGQGPTTSEPAQASSGATPGSSPGTTPSSVQSTQGSEPLLVAK